MLLVRNKRIKSTLESILFKKQESGNRVTKRTENKYYNGRCKSYLSSSNYMRCKLFKYPNQKTEIVRMDKKNMIQLHSVYKRHTLVKDTNRLKAKRERKIHHASS